MTTNLAWPINPWAGHAGLGTAIMAVLLLSGCGSRQPKPCPVSGTVMVNGQPGPGVYVLFHAVDNLKRKGRPDLAKTEADGSFSAKVHGPGEYAVTIFWPTVTEEDGEVTEGEDQFQGKLQNPENPVLKLTIQKGDNVLPPIRLTLP